MKKAKLRIGIIGCGAIGSEIARACQDRLRDKVELFAVCDKDEKKAFGLTAVLAEKAPVLKMDDLIRGADLVIEAASASVSAEAVEKCIRNKKRCMIMSVGGLLGKEGLLKSAREEGVSLYMPSGALCGIDGLKAASVGSIESVELTTRKPLRGLEGAPYLSEKNIDLNAIKEETVVFEGSAEEAVKGFPQNVNVSAVLSLAGIGARKTRVRIVTSSSYAKNVHEVEIKGEFGIIRTRTENVPSKTNPKTSAMAIFSAIATLEGIADSVRIGT